MKIAIISVSFKGKKLAHQLKEKLDKDSTIISTVLYHKNVRKYFQLIFYEYDAIIAIMASGVLVRSIALLIESKVTDPAILNIDDNGNFVISVLSGHLGGANELCGKVSRLIDATPVITTSTDVNKKLGIDTLAKDLYLSISNTNEILHFNKAILDNKRIFIKLNDKSNYDYLYEYLSKVTLEIDVLISQSSKIDPNEILCRVENHELTLIPKKIIVGIGCRRGKKCEEIEEKLDMALNTLNLSKSRINGLASAEIKKDEKGILNLAKKLDISVNFVELDKLRLFSSKNVQKSEFVYSKFGIYGVCEPSALITAGFDSKLIYKKTQNDGVTISIAVSK